jgi:triacylglycerol lipase
MNFVPEIKRSNEFEESSRVSLNDVGDRMSLFLTDDIPKITKRVVGVGGDIIGMFVGGVALIPAAYNKWKNIDYDPKEVIVGKIPILMLHGKSYNQTEWLMGRHFLSKFDDIGSIFSVDYDGLCSNDDSKTIEDYARTVISDKILEICEKTQTDKVILIGHSLGGLIASFYAENISETDNIEVVRVITISTPWKEPPMLKYVNRLHRQVLNEQMMEVNLQTMRIKATRNIDRYRSFGSFDDVLVSNENATLSSNVHTSYNWYGHHTIVLSPRMWNDIHDVIIS